MKLGSRFVGLTPAYSASLVACALISALIVAACDSGSQATTPTNGGGTMTSSPVATGGAAVFMRNCNVCHPGGGRGAGPSLIALAPGMSDDQIKGVVRSGKQRMPPYGPEVISDDQLAELVGYIRTLK